jgi:uncharacterized OB-fold protein
MNLPHFEPPSDDDVAAPFWAAINDGHIELPRCTGCGRWQWYPDDAGADCPGESLRWETVASSGTVHTATRVERAFLPGGRDDVPFVVGFVELDGVDGVRLVANVVDDGTVAIGSRVEASFVPLGDRRHLVFVAQEQTP